MSYVLAGVCAMNLLTFARAMPRFAAPDGWPARMRWLSLCGMACACVGIAAAVTAAAPPMRALVGVALAMASHALFRWAIDVALRHRFAIAFADAHPSELTTEGPYRWLAHPLYVSYAATWWALAVGSMHWAPTAGALLMSAFYVSAALGENRTLRALHSPAGKSVQVVEVQMGIESTNGRRPANKRDAWWESLVRPATSRLDLEAAFALRYRVYVDECRKPYPGADHQRRLLSDAWDAHSCVLIAERDGHVAGTIRGTLGREPGFAEAHGRVFAHLDEVRSVG